MASGGAGGSRSPSPGPHLPPPFPPPHGDGEAADSDTEGEDIFAGTVSAGLGREGGGPRGPGAWRRPRRWGWGRQLGPRPWGLGWGWGWGSRQPPPSTQPSVLGFRGCAEWWPQLKAAGSQLL